MDCCVRAPSPSSSERVDRMGRRPAPPRVPRANGWSRPLHPLQVLSWAIFLLLGGAVFLIFIPLLPHVWKFTAYGVTGTCFFLYLVVHVVAISIDPAEPNVRHKSNYRQAVPAFDRARQAHVIQNRFCCLCQVAVGPKTKHCSACNKCVAGFDHHCKWLNSCVGSRNYWFFLSSVALALAGMLCVLAILVCIFIQYFVSPTWLRTDPSFSAVTSAKTWLLFLPFAAVKTKAWVVLSIGVFVALLTVSGLVILGHLFVFHLYLMSSGLSTLEYITHGHKQQGPTGPPPVKRSSSKTELPQQTDSSPSPAAGRCPRWCSATTRKPETTAQPGATAQPKERNDNSSSSALRRETSSRIPSKRLPDVDSVSITISPENPSPVKLNDNCSSSAPRSVASRENSPVEMTPVDAISITMYPEDPQPSVPSNKFTSPAPGSVPSRENSSVEMTPVEAINIPMYPEDSPPPVLTNNFTSPAPWGVASRENSPVETIPVEAINIPMYPEDSPPPVMTNNFTSPAPWGVASRENSPVETIPVEAINIPMYPEDSPPPVMTNNFTSPAPWGVASRENSPVEMTPVDAINIPTCPEDSPPPVLNNDFTSLSPWGVVTRENSPVEMTPVDAINIPMCPEDSPPPVLNNNFTSLSPWSVPSRENSPVEMTPIDAIRITMCCEDPPPAVLTDNLTSPTPWSVPSRENSPVEMTPVEAINIPMYPEDSPPPIPTDNFISPAPWSVPSRENSPVEFTPIDSIRITMYPENQPPETLTENFTSPAPCTMVSNNRPLTGFSAIDSISTYSEDSAPAEVEGGPSSPEPRARHVVLPPLSRTSSSSSVVSSVSSQSASLTKVARDQREETKRPMCGESTEAEGSAFGAKAEWLERAPEPARYRPGPSQRRGRIRPATPVPGPWRVQLNSRERLATTTMFLEDLEEDIEEAGDLLPAPLPKEVFECWGEPSGKVGLPVAQGRPRASLCTEQSTQFSCSSVDSVEPADGTSPECPKPDQSDLWEGQDL